MRPGLSPGCPGGVSSPANCWPNPTIPMDAAAASGDTSVQSCRGGLRLAQDIILSTTGLTKEFKGFRAVNDVACEVGARHHPRADRPERRRQDHLLQPAHEVPQPDARAILYKGRDISRLQPADVARLGSGALVPDLGGVPASHGAGERPHRAAAAQARRFVRFLALRGVLRRLDAEALELVDAGRPRGVRPAHRRWSCPMAASARSRSRRRWRSIPRCCCSTSRWRAWATRTSSASRR